MSLSEEAVVQRALNLQARLAEVMGDTDEAERLRARVPSVAPTSGGAHDERTQPEVGDADEDRGPDGSDWARAQRMLDRDDLLTRSEVELYLKSVLARYWVRPAVPWALFDPLLDRHCNLRMFPYDRPLHFFDLMAEGLETEPVEALGGDYLRRLVQDSVACGGQLRGSEANVDRLGTTSIGGPGGEVIVYSVGRVASDREVARRPELRSMH